VAHRNLPDGVTEDMEGLKSARMLARYEALACKMAGVLCSKDRANGLLIVGEVTSGHALFSVGMWNY